jgi:hypothetical protein
MPTDRPRTEVPRRPTHVRSDSYGSTRGALYGPHHPHRVSSSPSQNRLREDGRQAVADTSSRNFDSSRFSLPQRDSLRSSSGGTTVMDPTGLALLLGDNDSSSSSWRHANRNEAERANSALYQPPQLLPRHRGVDMKRDRVVAQAKDRVRVFYPDYENNEDGDNDDDDDDDETDDSAWSDETTTVPRHCCDPTAWLLSDAQLDSQGRAYFDHTHRWTLAAAVRHILYNPLAPEFTSLQQFDWACIIGVVMGVYILVECRADLFPPSGSLY